MIQIVVADDQPMFTEMLARSLDAYEDIEVVGTTSDGLEAVDLCERLEPDLVIMDLRMNGCDGIQATQMIKASSPGVRVLVLTMENDPGVIARAIRADIDGYIVKSAGIGELHRAIGSVCAGLKVLDREAFAMIARHDHHNGKRPVPPSDNGHHPFTGREREILHLMTSGLSTSEIAAHLHLSRGSVYNYISQMMSRLNVQTRVQLAAFALQQGVIS